MPIMIRCCTYLFILSSLVGFLLIPNSGFSQCQPTQSRVFIEVETDDYAYEGYWELVPSGNSCGQGTIFSGGNSGQVGCNGANDRDATQGNGYQNNQTIVEGSWCLTTGQDYDLIYIDDYGDGGFTFHVEVEGFIIADFVGDAGSHRYTFTASPPPAYDGAISKIETPSFGSVGANIIRGELANMGSTSVTSAELNYQIDNQPIVTQTFNFLPTSFGNTAAFSFSAPFVALNPGTYNVRVWVSQIGGQADMNASNNEESFDLTLSPPIPNIITNFINEGYISQTIATQSDQLSTPRDLDFHPDLNQKELWVLNMDNSNTGGSTLTIDNAGESNQNIQWVRDGNAWHFMAMPTALVFGDNGNFGTTPGLQDANHSGGTFTGPSLWSSDLSIYGVIGNPPTQQDNGSHLDMLHGSPYGMGMAHERDNVYWVWDTYYEDLVRYDFLEDHGPGQHYHGDGLVRRYTEIQAQRFNDRVPSHMVIDDNTGWLYIADARNGQVIRVNINSGNQSATLPLINEPLAEHTEWSNVTRETIVAPGVMVRPTGIEVIGNNLLVSDYQTGEIVIFDVTTGTANEIGRIATGAQEIMGIKIGPDGNIWYVDAGANEVKKLTANEPTVGIEDGLTEVDFTVYPNPTNGIVSVQMSELGGTIQVYDMTGSLVDAQVVINYSSTIDLNQYPQGLYQVEWYYEGERISKRVMKY